MIITIASSSTLTEINWKLTTNKTAKNINLITAATSTIWYFIAFRCSSGLFCSISIYFLSDRGHFDNNFGIATSRASVNGYQLVLDARCTAVGAGDVAWCDWCSVDGGVVALQGMQQRAYQQPTFNQERRLTICVRKHTLIAIDFLIYHFIPLYCFPSATALCTGPCNKRAGSRTLLRLLLLCCHSCSVFVLRFSRRCFVLFEFDAAV